MIHTPECQANCPCCAGEWDCNCGALENVPLKNWQKVDTPEQQEIEHINLKNQKEHDPLCPQQPRPDGTTLTMQDGVPVICHCDLIANVREEEHRTAFDEGYEAGAALLLSDWDEAAKRVFERLTLAAAVQRVESLPWGMAWWMNYENGRDPMRETISAIKGES